MQNVTNHQKSAARKWLYFLLWIGASGSASGCKDKPVTPPPSAATASEWFEDVTRHSGLNFIHDAGPVGTYFFPQIMGSGCALLDYDNDGRLDILLIQNGGPTGKKNQLFHQEPDGTFKDVSEGSGLDFASYGMGVAIGDVNNDGLPDVLITEFGKIRLFLNQGGGKFKEVTAEAGLDDPLWATSAAFVDFDRDGWLDLVVVNYVHYDPSIPCKSQLGEPDYCSPIAFAGTSTKLFRNLGAAGAGKPATPRFEDVSVKSGVGLKIGPGLGVLCADFDNDGWPDILVTNDGKPNHLWMNQRDGTFKEEGVLRGVALNAVGNAEANMGATIGDTDGGGAFDLFVTHLKEETNTLWSMNGPGLFFDRTVASGLSPPARRAAGFGHALDRKAGRFRLAK